MSQCNFRCSAYNFLLFFLVCWHFLRQSAYVSLAMAMAKTTHGTSQWIVLCMQKNSVQTKRKSIQKHTWCKILCYFAWQKFHMCIMTFRYNFLHSFNSRVFFVLFSYLFRLLSLHFDFCILRVCTQWRKVRYLQGYTHNITNICAWDAVERCVHDMITKYKKDNNVDS